MTDKRIPVIAPFRGLRYADASALADLTAPPYDVISEEGQKALYEKHRYNAVRLILGYQRPTDTDADNRYTRAAADLKKWIQTCVLVRDEAPSFYLYEQEFSLKDGSRHARRGFLALRRLAGFGEDELGKGKIQPHEKTLSGPKADRLLLMKSCHANLSPIFSLYSDPDRTLSAVLKPHFSEKPFAEFSDPDGVRQRLWRVSDPELFRRTDETIGRKNLFIADGHHRYETALAYREWMKGRFPNAPADASFHYVMMFFSDMEDPGLIILPTHRVLHDWPNFDAAALREGLGKWFGVTAYPASNEKAFLEALKSEGAAGRQALGLALPNRDFSLLTLSKEKRDAIPALASVAPASRGVDTQILHSVIFRELLGLKEEDDKDPCYMTFVKDAHEAIESLDARKAPKTNAVFLLNSPPMSVLRDVVEAGRILPPKTTFFYPKLLSGLVFHPLSESERVAI